jgi:phosphoribosylaminoimidazole-succinocarboxamide synthase
MNKVVMEVGLPFPQLGKGGNKIREVYDLSYVNRKYTFSDLSPEFALIVNTDRISTEDVVMENGIPNKGKVLNKISVEIFARTQKVCPNHFVSDKFEEFPKRIQVELMPYRKQLDGRSMLVYLAKPIEAEAIVRFRLTGSGYKEYVQDGMVCGINLPQGLEDGSKLSAPIFTPSTKAPIGQHDKAITFEELAMQLGSSKFPEYELAGKIRAFSISLASEISTILATKGIELVDTKFEFGEINGDLRQIDETATPDSSRYDPDYSKQPFREAMRKIGFDGETAMEVPDWLVEETSKNYRKMCRLITGTDVI